MNKRTGAITAADLDSLIEDITIDADGDDEQLRAFLVAFEDGMELPSDAFVIGEPVAVVGFDYAGNQRRGLVARCRKEDGSEHTVSAAARCRLVASDRVVTLRANRLWDAVPGEIAMVTPHKHWTYGGHPYLSGKIESSRLDVEALGLVPLRLEDQGSWTPEEHYWGEDDQPIEEWARPIIARGPRRSFAMEQVVPGRDPVDLDSDPICESNDLKDVGDHVAARQVLMELCQADLRCLDAHAHLGNAVFDLRVKDAIRHYEVGVRIGEHSLGSDFAGLLPWGYVDNRPFLRCMHGFGLCLWKFGRFEEAARVLERMLWLNPSDNQGVRFLIDEVRAEVAWNDREMES